MEARVNCRSSESARERHLPRSMKHIISSVNRDDSKRTGCATEFSATGKFRRLFRRKYLRDPRCPADHENIESEVPLSTHKPISIGLTCWLWQRSRRWTLIQLAEHFGVTLEIKQHRHGLYMEIEGQVSGENVDKFIGEFARRC